LVTVRRWPFCRSSRFPIDGQGDSEHDDAFLNDLLCLDPDGHSDVAFGV